jgi:hypothetical protein
VNDRPGAGELLEAVRRFLQDEVVPQLEGPRRYHARVAANVVAIVAREIELEGQQLADEWLRLAELLREPAAPPAGRAELCDALCSRTEELVRRIRAGEADTGPWREAVLAHLRATVDAKLAVARPPRGGGA